MRNQDSIVETKEEGRSLRIVEMSCWPELKVAVNVEFVVEREAGRAVRRDSIDRIPLVLIFHGTGAQLGHEKTQYDPQTKVLFNPTAYNNELLFLSYIDEFLIPAFEGKPSLFALDIAEFHKIPVILQKLRSQNITPTLVPAGCTGLVQSLNISVNQPFKDILRDLTELEIISQEANRLAKWSVGDRQISTTWCVGKAWAQFTGGETGKKIIQDTFQNVGLALLIDGSQDSELRIKGFTTDEMVIGDWSLHGLLDAVEQEGLESNDDNTAVDFLYREEDM
ncbi:hypothetical protein L873DRAFT_1928813 [Choiromyces venosus 120613-1]|uniref:DDE-1 domain-containing protein n=1 Tax=Choiromyces venosus 120613-1 TaxID=1336337 RepID=A0A3N4K2A6_9PEZI|nr:hypothetical protein L873DRAFT_1928813 [Choiromyces venosus 120613-1]